MSIQGLKTLKAAIKRHKKATAKGLKKGLLRAGLFIQRESQKVVPVDKGFLKASADTRAVGRGLDVEVIISYSANYAIYVHEDLTVRHQAGKKAKFLEDQVREHPKRVQELIEEGIQEEL